MATYLLKYLFLFTFTLTVSKELFRQSQPLANNDQRFNSYLLNVTTYYTKWLKENALDPSEPINKVLHLESKETSTVFLKCNVTNQKVFGHSDTWPIMTGAMSNFMTKSFRITRASLNGPQFGGNFRCTGKVDTAPEVVYFNGLGTYYMQTDISDEVVTYSNIGVTTGYKLNFTFALLEYFNSTSFNSSELHATWNDSKITHFFLGSITNEFTKLYHSHIWGSTELNPMRALLPAFVRNVTENLDLTKIMSKGDLPFLYIPTMPSEESGGTSLFNPTLIVILISLLVPQIPKY